LHKLANSTPSRRGEDAADRDLSYYQKKLSIQKETSWLRFRYERPEKEVVKEPQGVPISCDGLSK
jgi:hypothetical protein